MTRKFSLTFDVPDGLTVADLARLLGYVSEHFTIGLTSDERDQSKPPNARGAVWCGRGGTLGTFALVDSTATHDGARYHAACSACGYIGRSCDTEADAESDGAEHEIALGTNEQHHPTRVVTELVLAGTATSQRVSPTPGPRRNHVLIWARSEAAARLYFGALPETPVSLMKACPETDEEKAKYHPDAKLFAIEVKPKTSDIEHATIGVRRNK